MMTLSSSEFARMRGISDRAARKAFSKRQYCGHQLSIVHDFSARGGNGGRILRLNVDASSPALLTLLGLPETSSSPPVERRIQTRSDDRHIAIALDKQRIIAPILITKRGSAERAQAFRDVAAKPVHEISGKLQPVAERTLRDWVNAAETSLAGLLPVARKDRGKRRVRITRRWQNECGLPDDVQARIEGRLEEIARGLLSHGRSDRNVRKLCSSELQKLTVVAGVALPKARMAALCDVSPKWVARFGEMKVVHAHRQDHKRYSDKHEYHLKLGLTERPMEVLMGDVHHVDLTIAQALASDSAALRDTAFSAALAGERKIKAFLIGWMDGSSGFMWVTPVICGPGQAITQQDVALSLYQVLTCEYGGMPLEFRVDNGSEFKFLPESVTRFASMAELNGLSVVKCRPHHPEGKARLEGAFGIIKKSFFSALPGYNGGNPLKPLLKGRGKPVAPYDRGPERLLEDLHLAIAQYNGTAQDGDLQGRSPKAMLEAKIALSGWRAQQINDADLFDLVFSREERRDVRQGRITIGTRSFTGPVLAEMIGEKQVSFLVPWRDPDGAILHFRDGVIHRLAPDTCALNDRSGVHRRAEMVGLQHAELARRASKADATVDVQQMLSDAADLGPVQHNTADSWSFTALDKGSFIGGPISEEEARARQDAEWRADIEEFNALARAGKREASGGNRQTSRAQRDH